jgi:mortality factor 4-like protein 1
MPPKFKFQEGEKVLCFHGPHIYEAKCLEAEMEDDQIRYYIHYIGWNKSWDEWVPTSRVLKYNDANVQKQKELQIVHKANRQKKKKATKTRNSESGVEDSDVRASTSSAPSSSQVSSSGVPRKKRGRLVAAVETLVNLPAKAAVEQSSRIASNTRRQVKATPPTSMPYR